MAHKASTAPAKTSFKTIVTASLAGLFVLQLVLFGVTMHANRTTRNDSDAANQFTYNTIDTNNQLLSLSVLPGQNRLYVPELNLTVPLNLQTRALRYSFEEGTTNNVRLTSALMTDHAVHTQSCSDMVRLKIEDKADAYSPSQPLYASVSLSDGRTLQIYASTTKECNQAWVNVSPQAIAEQFKSAAIYQ